MNQSSPTRRFIFCFVITILCKLNLNEFQRCPENQALIGIGGPPSEVMMGEGEAVGVDMGDDAIQENHPVARPKISHQL